MFRFLRTRLSNAPGRWLWPLAAMAGALVPVAGAFSTTHVFHVRDLGLFFWPRHLWIRERLLDGQFPLWDPSAAAGQSAAADALNHLFLPFAIALRFLPPVVGFNLWIALPFPLAALGVYVLLREHVSRSAAALGALVFVASGPVVSSGNFPNFSWAVAAMPWVVWSAGRLARAPSRTRFTVTSGLVALQALAGEPVTLFATGAVAAAWAWHGREPRPMPARLRSLAWFVAACAVAMLLAAVQLVPLAAAAAGSTRVGLADPGMWSLHPLALIEALSPHFFGDTYEASFDRLQWVKPLNSDREPLLFSLYLGIGALLVAAHGCCAGPGPARRLARFWGAVTLVAAVLSFGTYTPLYTVVLEFLPVLQGLRFPVKYLAGAALGLAVLAGVGWDQLRQRPREGRGPCDLPAASLAAYAIAMLAATTVIIALAAPAWAIRAASAVGFLVGVEDAAAAGVYLAGTLPAFGGRLVLLAVVAGTLIWIAASRKPEARLATGALFALLLIDPLSVNARLHPTLPAEALGPPSWTRALPQGTGARVYAGGRLTLPGTTDRLDAIERSAVDVDESHTMIDAQTLAFVQYALAPSAWGFREIVSYDLPQLWPREYHLAMRRFASADRESRLRFLSRVGVRYCLLPEPPSPAAAPLAEARWLPRMALYECGGDGERVRVVPEARIDADLERQMTILLSPGFDSDETVLLATSPSAPRVSRPGTSPAGVDPATHGGSSAVLVVDELTRVVARAHAGHAGGYLLLLDSYDPGWRVYVDGQPADLLRANVLFRAVRLAPGTHLVEFRYHPMPLYFGAAVSAAAFGGVLLALVISTAPFLHRRRAVQSRLFRSRHGASPVTPWG